MAPAPSKVASNQQLYYNILQSISKNTTRKVACGSALLIIVLLIRISLKLKFEKNNNISPTKITSLAQIQDELRKKREREKGKGKVNKEFLLNLLKLVKIVIPHWTHPAVGNLCVLTFLLVARTYLSIYVSSATARIVKAIVQLKFSLFISRIVQLALLAVPASFVNSLLDYLNKQLAVHFRTELTNYFTKVYLKDLIFYQVTNLDSRVENPDQYLTSNIEKWANSLSLIYSNFTKPLLDIILFSRKLTQLVGWLGPGIVIFWYAMSGFVMKLVTPSFGVLTAHAQIYEGDYRACHASLVTFSEEIAFYRGHEWEKARIWRSFQTMMRKKREIMQKKLVQGIFDGMLTKYGALMVGYAILGLPVFGPGNQEYLKKTAADPSQITRDYVRNSSLLINLAKAIGRLTISYKEIQELAGYTSLVADINEVFQNLRKGQYKRRVVDKKKINKDEIDLGYSAQIENSQIIASQSIKGQQQQNEIALAGQSNVPNNDMKQLELMKGQYFTDEKIDFIEFRDVPIQTPNEDTLVEKMSLRIEPGMNVVISGPNGCGKSSMFRIMGRLWPLAGGQIVRPDDKELFYIPQRPYLPPGSLRDQIIYPHTPEDMRLNNHTDAQLCEFLEQVRLSEMLQKEQNGLDTVRDWNIWLSGGEKQRIAMARLFYHKPKFAILDECTSQVELDVEAILYSTCREKKITLFTVSHRQSAFKYHQYKLWFDGKGKYGLIPLEAQQENVPQQ